MTAKRAVKKPATSAAEAETPAKRPKITKDEVQNPTPAAANTETPSKKQKAAKKRSAKKEKSASSPTKTHKVEKEEIKTEDVKVEAGAVIVPAEVLPKIMEQARVAVASLVKYVSDQESKSLFPESDHGISVLVTYKKPALVNGATQKKRIILPHATLSATSAMFCVIMPDLDTSKEARMDHDVDKQALEWEERIEASHGLSKKNIAKIYTKRQLERECNTNLAKRKLASAYDLFLVEKTVHKSVHSHLGKEFHRAHKMPLSFDFTKDMVNVMKKAVATSIYDLTANKLRVAVRAGHVAQPHADVVENVEHVISEIVANCPGGLSNIRSFFVQLSSSKPSLPIYTDDGSANVISLPAPVEKNKKSENREIVDELSTLPEGLAVAVTKSGKVRVVSEKTGKSIVYPTVKDEWEEKDMLKPHTDVGKMKKKRNVKKRRQSLAKMKALKKVKSETADFKAIIKGVAPKEE